jgi:D-glycero-D-manno-heptose 1,7-bisphosphate phosphatase
VEDLRPKAVPGPRGRALLVDRDGTICEEVGYLASAERLRLIPGSAAALRRAREAGFRTVIVTNQSGVARGLLDESAVDEIHEELRRLLRLEGALVDAIYYCPHHPEHGDDRYRRDCDCRKPRPGMLLRAARELGLNLAASYTIGDRVRDLIAGHRVGTRTVLVRTGYGAREVEYHASGDAFRPDHVAADLAEAVDWILTRDTTENEPMEEPPS